MKKEAAKMPPKITKNEINSGSSCLERAKKTMPQSLKMEAKGSQNQPTKSQSADPSAVGVSDLCLLLQIPQIHTNPYSTKCRSSLILPLPPILPLAWYYLYPRYYR